MNSHLSLLSQLARLEIDSAQAVALQKALSDVSDWSDLLRQAESYGVANLLHKHVRDHALEIPASAGLSLKALSMRHRSAADARYQVMTEMDAAFRAAGIPLVALKGLALAPMVYPADELRPMRDIDVLVPAAQEQAAGELLRELGFDLPLEQPSKYMADAHQLPNATKKVNGFTVSVELHHDALSRDVPESMTYEDVAGSLQTVRWRELALSTLGHEQMLYQVARHMGGTHPGAVLKLINVLDVVLYAETYQAEIDWPALRKRRAYVVNALKCCHQIVPLSAALQANLGGVSEQRSEGVGETMRSLTSVLRRSGPINERFKALFLPPDWWLHLYYNVDPAQSLAWIKLFRHPVTILRWLGQRLKSRLFAS